MSIMSITSIYLYIYIYRYLYLYIYLSVHPVHDSSHSTVNMTSFNLLLAHHIFLSVLLQSLRHSSSVLTERTCPQRTGSSQPETLKSTDAVYIYKNTHLFKRSPNESHSPWGRVMCISSHRATACHMLPSSESPEEAKCMELKEDKD